MTDLPKPGDVRIWNGKTWHTTPPWVRVLDERVNGEAEARAHLAGQFHEALPQIIQFAKAAHQSIEIAEANIFALTKQHERLTTLVEQHVQHTTARDDALATALQAVYEITKPRPSRWSRLTQWLGRNTGVSGDIEARRVRGCRVVR